MTDFMDKVFTKLDGVRLTLTQWVIASLAAIVGILVLALRLQGSKLHRTQVKLIATQIDAQDATDDAKVKTAQEKLEKALQAYRDAGGAL